MIKKSEKQIELEFGKGDICITGGYYLGKNKERIGIVTFIDQQSREIGSVGMIKGGQEYKVGDFPIVMTFTKSESIDALIGQLEQAKREMLVAIEECPCMKEESINCGMKCSRCGREL